MENRDFAQRILTARRMRGVSMRELARLVNVSVQSAFLWEKEGTERIPRADVMVRIARVLDIDLEWLISGQGSTDPRGAERLKSYPLETLMEAISQKGFEVSVIARANSSQEGDAVAQPNPLTDPNKR